MHRTGKAASRRPTNRPTLEVGQIENGIKLARFLKPQETTPSASGKLVDQFKLSDCTFGERSD